MTRMFSLFGKNGTMEEIIPTGGLPKFTKLTCFFMAGSYGKAMIVEELQENGTQKACYVSGDRKGFFVVDQYIKPESKEFGIGTYYNDNLETYSDEEALKIIARATKEEKELLEAEQLKKDADRREKELLPTLYPMLTINSNDDYTVTKKNLVELLKHKFKGFKFSVKKDYYNSYSVSWTNGPTESEVKEVTDLFVSFVTDFTGDFRDYEPTNFNRVFGGFKYVSTYREQSDEVKNLTQQLKEYFTESDIENDRYCIEKTLREMFSKTSFPVQFKIKGIHVDDTKLFEKRFSIEFENSNTTPDKEIILLNYTIVDYSEKAIAVIGETKPISEKLKGIGGRFNAKLSCGAGWIFPKTKKEQVINLLESLK